MGKITGFLEHNRKKQPYRPVQKRLKDWQQVMDSWPADELNAQASRCMNCGIPFCHQACPLGNLIPEWNDLVYHEQWKEAIQRLHETNNFPEFTGTLCPAPCEGGCVLDLYGAPVHIKAVELAIIDKAWENGWVKPEPAIKKTNKKIAIIGSGPAGLAAAQQLIRIGHSITVLEKSDRIGGLLRYGIPEFKMEKRVLDRRLSQLRSEGIIFKTNTHVGVDLSAHQLRQDYDALLLTGGASIPRHLPIEGAELPGIHQAMDFLSKQNKVCEGDVDIEPISAKNKHVIIIGGGDTGADCLGTANRQGALSVFQLEIMPKPPMARISDNPWPKWPQIFRTSPAHEEGGGRLYCVSTERFIGTDHVEGLALVEVTKKQLDGNTQFTPIPNSEKILPSDLVLLAMGFTGPEDDILKELEINQDDKGNITCDDNWMTNQQGVFVAGDMHRGQSLIVWAIAEGRSAARGVDKYLMGDSDLPAPL